MANKSVKRTGIWMDHSEARIMEYGSSYIKKIHSPSKGRMRVNGEEGDGTRLGNFRSTNNESHKHYKKLEELHSYYKEVAEALMPYDEILILGPGTAKREFQNYLLNEKHLHDKRISTEDCDYVSENQQMERVSNFFENEN